MHSNSDPKKLDNIKAITYKWSISLFTPRCDLPKSQVTHLPVKTHALKSLQPKIKHIMLPICMDRVDGNQLYAPLNFLKLILLLQQKFMGFKFVVEVVLTGELNAYNIQRINHINNREQTLAEAQKEGRKRAEQYLCDLMPYIEQLELMGHHFTFKHWTEYTAIEKVQAINQHLLRRYECDVDYETYIDIALAKFFTRQVSLGDRAPARKVKPYNLNYIVNESAFLVYVYAYLRHQFDHMVYEQDHLSPQISDAACDAAKDYLAEDGITLEKPGDFYIEFLLQELNADMARTKQQTMEDFALLNKINALREIEPANIEVIKYGEASKTVNVLMSGCMFNPNFSLARLFNNSYYNESSTSDNTQNNVFGCYMVPYTSFKLGIYDKNPIQVSEGDGWSTHQAAWSFDRNVMQKYGIVFHYFELNNWNNSGQMSKSEQYLEARSLHVEPSTKQCLIAVFSSPEVEVYTFKCFEDIKRRAPGDFQVLYFGIFSNDLNKLRDRVANPLIVDGSVEEYCSVNLMDEDQQKHQLTKFMQKVMC